MVSAGRLMSAVHCAAVLIGGLASGCAVAAGAAQDEFSWLEQSRDAKALTWVKQQNERTFAALKSDPRYPKYYAEALAADRQVPSANLATSQGWIHEIARDETHPRGLWRRARADDYFKGRPQWQDILDIDALSREAGKSYEVHLMPWACQAHGTRCMLYITKGQSVAHSLREFDVNTRRFVNGGFNVPSYNNGSAWWEDEDTLLVQADFGPGSVDAAGFPLVVKRWKRGEPLAQGTEVFRVSADASAFTAIMPYVLRPHESSKTAAKLPILFDVSRGYFRSELWARLGSAAPTRLALPDFARLYAEYRGELIIKLRQSWSFEGHTWPAGSYLSVPLDKLMKGTIEVRPIRALGSREAAGPIEVTKNGLLLPLTRNVSGELWGYTFDGRRWSGHRVSLPENGAIRVLAADSGHESAPVSFESLTQPRTLYRASANAEAQVLNRSSASSPSSSSSPSSASSPSSYLTRQFETKSNDGTLIPYFIAMPSDFEYTAQAPTLMMGYGAAGAVEAPFHDPALQALWSQKGGVYVIANIRGGGELGPSWHVVRERRRLTYEDFVAVAQDLFRRKITAPAKLGITGMSSGGLLMGVMVTQHPQLFNAAIIQVPVLDLLRPDLLGTHEGNAAAIAEEFGSVDQPASRTFVQQTSPFQNLRRTPHFPAPFLITSTTDDNVHPAQARRFAAKAQHLRLPYYFLETAEGGHGMAVTPQQRAELNALMYVYLAQRLMDSSSTRN